MSDVGAAQSSLLFPREVLRPKVFIVAVKAHRGETRILVIVLRLPALEISYILRLSYPPPDDLCGACRQLLCAP